jgi:hypothetical protein
MLFSPIYVKQKTQNTLLKSKYQHGTKIYYFSLGSIITREKKEIKTYSMKMKVRNYIPLNKRFNDESL